jgi:RNA polymerase sigma-70 factor (ECF subfamily)
MITPQEQSPVDGCRRGDRQAQRTVFEQTSERIYALLRKMTRDAELAFDLTQDTYLRAFARIGDFDGRSSISTWLYRIAVNLAIQSSRRSALERRKLTILKQDRHPATRPESNDARIDVQTALDALSPVDRALLILRYEDGQDYRAIAAILGCAEGTVGSRLTRARDRMREILGEDYSTREGIDLPARPMDRSSTEPVLRTGKNDTAAQPSRRDRRT